MRLWHKSLIPYLPKQQLLTQWRECCAIAGSIAKKGTPNHLLVNKIVEYSFGHFASYIDIVCEEMKSRGYKINENKYKQLKDLVINGGILPNVTPDINNRVGGLFHNWHNDRYLRQCLFNLQEKYDCDGISEDEWMKISNEFGKYLY